ncbi:hypothetical protein EDB89DRAFT_60476 [Lactarius sanguifluus]|nr:hypothetical protein EDB89DRAFT_60476 [Lactarius sanguifluus]
MIVGFRELVLSLLSLFCPQKFVYSRQGIRDTCAEEAASIGGRSSRTTSRFSWHGIPNIQRSSKSSPRVLSFTHM